MPSISANMLVKNEARWVWYAIQSVLPYVDELIVFDTGSVDETPDIIAGIVDPKIRFERRSSVSAEEFPHLRQEQISKSRGDWILLVDGDEIWWKSGVEHFRRLVSDIDASGANIRSVYLRYWQCVWDVYHYVPERYGRVRIGPHKGFYNLRAFRWSFALLGAGMGLEAEWAD